MTDRDAVLAAMAGTKPAKPRDSQRDARRGRVACEHSDTPSKAEVGCRCLWGCFIGAGDKAKPQHIRLGKDWLCQIDHSSEDQV